MVLPDTQHFLDKKALLKPIAQNRQKVFILAVATRIEFAVVKFFVLQFVNIILL